jgi:hypothetical protein
MFYWQKYAVIINTDGVNVFYVVRKFKMDNPTQIIRKYSDDNIIFTKYCYVFTNTSMYIRKSHSKTGDYGVKINLVELSIQADLYC